VALITLTSDFGTEDFYVGALKGAILRHAPHARLVDLSHHIPPRDILAGAFLLRHAATEFPPGTIHLAVVDPGVGGTRLPMVLVSRGFIWVGPDNGLFSFALNDSGSPCVAYEITCPSRASGHPVSPTFHGRDLFAPTAGRLASGLPAESVGPPIVAPTRLTQTRPRRRDRMIEGQIIHVDRFGNLVTNIAASDLQSWGSSEVRIRLGGRILQGMSTTYSDTDEGGTLALIGSSRLLEIAVNAGSATEVLGVKRGEAVTVTRL
jgi:S-adenosylmethionine hydrolase